MVEFLLFCIATVGMTSIIVQGVIFQPFRQRVSDWAEKFPRRSWIGWFDELINCAQCTGFWCGLFCGLFLLASCGYFDGVGTVKITYCLLAWFCCGVGGSFLSSLGCNIIDWVFYRKMNALRLLEEQDIKLSERRANLSEIQE